MKHLLHIAVLLPVLSALSVAEPEITCEPRELHGVPGELLRLEITIETDRAVPAQLRVPHIDSLFLRTVEKVPIQRTKEGRYIQKRIVIWQGLEAASLTLTNLFVSFQDLEKKVPMFRIIIDEVTPAEPPKKPEVKK